MWAEKDSGRWSIFGVGGYAINPGLQQRDDWQTGLAMQCAFDERFSAVAEMYHQTPNMDGAKPFSGLNLGATNSPITGLFCFRPAMVCRKQSRAANTILMLHGKPLTEKRSPAVGYGRGSRKITRSEPGLIFGRPVCPGAVGSTSATAIKIRPVVGSMSIVRPDTPVSTVFSTL
jgi:hypothetical protein